MRQCQIPRSGWRRFRCSLSTLARVGRAGCRIARLVALGLLLGPPAAGLGQPGQFDRQPVNDAEEAYIVTPPGFSSPGQVAAPPAEGAAALEVRVVDRATGLPTPCRVAVVGSDGNYYFPAADRLSPYRLTGAWPDGQGNRPGKAPIRYFGRFCYSLGTLRVAVPPGATRVEVAKGLEYAPQQTSVELSVGEVRAVEISLAATADMQPLGYAGGDPHLHFRRQTPEDDELIFDLLEAEDIRYGQVLCYNDDTSHYQGRMQQQASGQFRGLGAASLARRGRAAILSGQEYRSGHYGHLNLYGRGEMVLAGADLDPNHWPVFGIVARETRAAGGWAIHAHGGYAQEILADAALQSTQGVELLQFGLYRGIGLSGWYHLLNSGYRFPAVGASDYPACRKLGDSLTYVAVAEGASPLDWLAGMAAGRSFVTTGPLVVLEVDGLRPGDSLHQPTAEPRSLTARIRVRCEVAPVTRVELVVNGQPARQWNLEGNETRGQWYEAQHALRVEASSWIAARAFSLAPTGNPDAESHTNPVYVYLAGRAPFQAASIAWWLGKLDEQIAALAARTFPQQERALEYFHQARARLEAIQAGGGLPAPPTVAADL